MGEFIVGVGGTLAIVLLALMLFGAGGTKARNEIVENCKNYAAFTVNGETRSCSPLPNSELPRNIVEDVEPRGMWEKDDES